MPDPFLGEIRMFAGNFAPRDWATCDGQLLQISQHTGLFSILGTTYGGDGRTTFALPDLRGRSPVHPGSGPGLSTVKLGERGGNETNVLSTSQLPAHTHDVNPQCSDAPGDQLNPGGNYPAQTQAIPFDQLPVAPAINGYASAGPQQMATTTSASTGGNQSVPNRSPYLAVNFIIALQGTFPSRT